MLIMGKGPGAAVAKKRPASAVQQKPKKPKFIIDRALELKDAELPEGWYWVVIILD